MNYICNKYNSILIKLSIKPYKTVRLETGLLVDHYRNGTLRADRRDVNGRITKATDYHG